MTYTVIDGIWYVKYNGVVIARGKNKTIAFATARKNLGWE